MNKEHNLLCRPVCELCGSKQNKIYLSKKFTDAAVWNFLEEYYGERVNKAELIDSKYEIAKCLECGFIWQRYILNDNLMEKLYNDWILPERSFNKKRYADKSLFSRYAQEAENIVHLLSKKPFEINVLDFGMGWGHWCLMAKAFGYNVWGFEVSRERIEFAKRNGINVIEEFSALNNYVFDFINAEQVFEHIPNPLQTLKLLVHSLKREGIFRIAVPNGE